MGICYSQQQQWDAYHKQVRQRRGQRKKKKTASIIVQQNTVHQDSFASKVINSFRDDIHVSIQNLVSQKGSIVIGSIVQMNSGQLTLLEESLKKINPNGQIHDLNQPVTLCNLKTKNFLHTHKVSFPHLPKLQQVSCCPYNSNHIVEYDIWQFIKVSSYIQAQQNIDSETSQSLIQNIEQLYFIYHPFTHKFLNFVKGHIVCSQQKKHWKIQSFGTRRNGGFVKITSKQGELCMTDDRGLITNHRKLQLCTNKHISHLWELQFGEIN